MAVDRYGQYICTVVENVLGPISVVVIQIQHCHFSVCTQILSGNRGRIEIAESPKGAVLGVVPGWAYQSVSEAIPFEDLLGGGQGAVN